MGKCVRKVPTSGDCTSLDICADDNAECIRDKCFCKQGYALLNNKCEPRFGIGAPCQDDDQCADGNARCDQQCICKEGFFPLNERCVQKPDVGGACDGPSYQCSDDNAICQNGTCQCVITHYLSGRRCGE
ncbi:signal peptide, CUB and EGF-like domain-containing protein 3 [Lingula anatina]|uniref:Signal peptide, CUB and EGF-like domain-containing protein 3 n=1 Tax=Lingula anatina TaxID=7574 RepID=A0A1S3JE30_LINAN|nr:signal peptide, CUB and EGF-like domain-containing protein 3 [Lingula anatina]|eukprot:XP_013408144.1 signal peptide, CUB and EGF-like domain-containing protein 3 [Lingula anatina]